VGDLTPAMHLERSNAGLNKGYLTTKMFELTTKRRKRTPPRLTKAYWDVAAWVGLTAYMLNTRSEEQNMGIFLY